MNLEDKARELRSKSEFYASIIADQTVLVGINIVPEDICHAYVDGYQSRDEEVKRLEEVVLEMVQTIEELEQVSIVPLFPRGEKHPFNIYSSLIKELKERG